MPKSTHAEFIQKVNKTVELLLCELTRKDIIRYNTENWGVSDRQIDKYIHEATKIIKAHTIENQEEWTKKASQKLKDLYKKNMASKNYYECRNIIMSENKIFGYETTSVKIDGNLSVKKEEVETLEEDIKEILKQELMEKDESGITE